MSLLRTPDHEGAKAFYGAVFGWTTEAFGPMLLWRLPGYVGGVPEQPVSREVVAVMARAGDGEAAHWRVDFWIGTIETLASRVSRKQPHAECDGRGRECDCGWACSGVSLLSAMRALAAASAAGRPKLARSGGDRAARRGAALSPAAGAAARRA